MRFVSAGERVVVEAESAWAARLIDRALGRVEPLGEEPTVRLRIERGREAFPCDGLRTVTRGAVSDGRRTVLTDVGGSGFDLRVDVDDQVVSVTARYRPPTMTRAANLALSGRFALLAGQVLVHYPVLWRAGWRGRVPLHVAAVATADGTPLLAGPGGIGKSTVLVGLLAHGATATADNLCCADHERCFGLVEPLRVDRAATASPRQRTSHGRVDRPLPGRVAQLTPDRVVVLERGPRTEITAIGPDEAARTLIAGTYAAGELRRYWAFAATLALATGRGPAHPPVAETARAIAGRLPCARMRVGDGATVRAAELCGVLT